MKKWTTWKCNATIIANHKAVVGDCFPKGSAVARTHNSFRPRLFRLLGDIMDWIKVEKATGRKPEVLRIADILGIHPDHALGLCIRFWCWCDDNMAIGHAPTVTSVTLDSVFGHAGFTEALRQVGWFVSDDTEIRIPKFDRHLSESAKKRAEDQERQRKHRGKAKQTVTGVSQNDCDKSVTRGDKRREEEIREEKTEEKTKTAAAPLAVSDGDLTVAWNRAIGLQPIKRFTSKRKTALRVRCSDPHFVEHWQAAIERISGSTFCTGGGSTGWIADVDWFLKPDTVTKILEGKYDNHDKPTGLTPVHRPRIPEPGSEELLNWRP